ncbi:hypothetical protein Noda2021_09050 [Candidatus Dependentiae bacterium Noda2021]|nr:hypothetical protein Noda2021_09050 [Candidatus Dependentiae bacterium Noda2021]
MIGAAVKNERYEPKIKLTFNNEPILSTLVKSRALTAEEKLVDTFMYLLRFKLIKNCTIIGYSQTRMLSTVV